MRSQMDFINSSHQELTFKANSILDKRKELQNQLHLEIQNQQNQCDHV